ncbi:MAG: ABC transporter ATP-binding protein, partial [Aeromonadaceae bacterium]
FGELPLQAGTIRFNGHTLADLGANRWRQQFGYMPQNNQLELELSVLEVVVLGRLQSLKLRLSDDDLRAAMTALQSLGMAHLADSPMSTLSGGQRQMVLFAQVLLREPQIMLLDEPVSALDLQHQMQLMEHLHHQTRQRNWISLVVLHDLNLAAQFADELIVLADGRLQAMGPPSEVLTEALISQLYQVPVQIHHDDAGLPYIRTLRRAS